MPIKPEHLDELLAGYEKPEDLLGENGLFKQLKKALLERPIGAELTHHLGYERGDPLVLLIIVCISLHCWQNGSERVVIVWVFGTCCDVGDKLSTLAAMQQSCDGNLDPKFVALVRLLFADAFYCKE